MKKGFTSYLKMGLFTLCAGLLSSAAGATTFTAVASGNFNAAATWGGSAPASTLSSDVIIIPSGITVTLTGDETFTGTASLTVNGTLTSSASALIMTSGTLVGSGTIVVDSIALGLTSGITYVGTITANKFTSTGATIATAANITVSSKLRLVSSMLSLTAGSLTMSSGSAIEISGGQVNASGSGLLTFSNPYSVSYINASANTGAELSGTGLTNVTINVPGTVSLNTDLTMKGTLTLTAGTLALNGKNLNFNGMADFSAAGSGTISSTLASNITVSSATNFTGGLRFAASGNAVNNFTMNMADTNSSISLGSNMIINGQLSLQAGKIKIGANNISIVAGGGITGGASKSYVITNGTGSLTMHLIAGGTTTFTVGSMLHYTPAVIVANSGSASGDVSVTAIDTVYAHGTSGVILSAMQPVVATTWYVSSTATTGINYNMQLVWSANAEVNGFNRTQAYISHYTSGAWDVTASGSAVTTASGYSVTRNNITSLSPFTVADKNANMTKVANVFANNNTISIYPNPVTGTMYFTTSIKVKSISIYNMNGQLVKNINTTNNTNSISLQELPKGVYAAYFLGQDNNITVHKFIKE
jgi:hypothetical protein